MSLRAVLHLLVMFLGRQAVPVLGLTYCLGPFTGIRDVAQNGARSSSKVMMMVCCVLPPPGDVVTDALLQARGAMGPAKTKHAAAALLTPGPAAPEVGV